MEVTLNNADDIVISNGINNQSLVLFMPSKGFFVPDMYLYIPKEVAEVLIPRLVKALEDLK